MMTKRFGNLSILSIHKELTDSINHISKKCSDRKKNSFPEKEKINILIKCLNLKKATGPDGISLKIIKFSANVIHKHLTNIIKHRFRIFTFLRKC